MLRYLIKRLFALIPVLLAVAFLIFTMMYFTPGDPATIILGDQASPEQVAEWRAARDLDKPFLTQFGIYLSKIVFHGDFGISYKTGKNVTSALLERFPTLSSEQFPWLKISRIQDPTRKSPHWR